MTTQANPNFNDLFSTLMGGLPKQSDKWYHSYTYAELPKFDTANLISSVRSALFARALLSDEVVYEHHLQAKVDDQEKVLNLLIEVEAVLKFQHTNGIDNTRFFVFDDGGAELSITKDAKYLSLTVVTTNKTISNLFKKSVTV